ncbi:MAG TPA: tRNA lysidine(34) synthetase TilS, partial [Dissulfurispiraceae bacterium]|nr:tRNA lysidine(34) synthetase TilS [Dissulfurispiraceae bacterium]
AYVDHGLRPEETRREAEFCGELCRTRDIPYVTKAVDVRAFAQSEKLTIQEAARELRYGTLSEIAAQVQANRIALGHHADDQAETVIMRLIRGTGPTGLGGIPPVRGPFIRPLIEIRREEIEDHLLKIEPVHPGGLPFVLDSSNLKELYLRNKIRRLIMPEIKKINKEFVAATSRLAEIFRDEERYFDLLVTKSLMRLITRKSDLSIHLFLAPIEAMDTVLLRRTIRRAIDETRGLRGISFVHVEDIVRLVKSGRAGDRVYLPGGVRAIKEYATLVLTSEPPKRLSEVVIEKPGDAVLAESGIVLRSRIVAPEDVARLGDGRTIAHIDAGRIRFPLLARAREQGDAFHPLGFGRRKKIQDFFVDEKVPRDKRDSVPILVSDGQIVWVVGYRLDDRFKVDKTTERILEFEIKPFHS